MEGLRTVFRFAPKGVSYNGMHSITTGLIYGVSNSLFRVRLTPLKITDENFLEFSPPYDGTLYEVLFRFSDALAVINYSNVNVAVITQEAIIDYNLNDRRIVNSFILGAKDIVFNTPMVYYGVEKPIVKTYEICPPIEFICEPEDGKGISFKGHLHKEIQYEEINPDSFKIDNYRQFAFDTTKSKILVINGKQVWID